MASTNYYREDTALINVEVPGIFNSQFVSIDGGHAESATQHIFPGNEEGALAIGGLVTPADVTTECHYTDTTAGWVQALYKACGKSRVTAHVIPKDGDGNQNPAGTITWSGILKTVTVPKRDSATSAKAMLILVFTPDAGITV